MWLALLSTSNAREPQLLDGIW